MLLQTKTSPTGWLAFELNVLRRLKFTSVATPFTPEPALGNYLKRVNVKVMANDPLQSAWTCSLATIQNNGETLTDDDVNVILEDVYVPGYKLANAALRSWFSETDAWWFDNIRRNLDRLQSPFAFAIGASLVMDVGDYVRSFIEETRELRQPLSNVLRRLWSLRAAPVNNGLNNTCQNKSVRDFIAENQGDLLFLRLPPSRVSNRFGIPDNAVWREEWLRGGNDFWPDFESSRSGMLGMPVGTKSQYIDLLTHSLENAKHFRTWAVMHVETGLISTEEIIEAIRKVRKVAAVYSKDFSELTGAKAVIITT